MNEEYDPEELEQLVEGALKEIEESTGYSLFSFGDTQIIRHLDSILGEYVNKAEANNIMASLREKLLDGMAGQQDPAKTLRSLHGVVSKCRVCPNVVPEPHLPKWNLSDPDVVFVTDTPLKGSEADTFFVNTLKDVGFRSARLAVTSIARCFPKENRAPNPDEISNCSTRYLFSELQLLKPRLIVAVGGISISTLVADKIKITEERGNIFWTGPWPIMAIYSPSYALRSDKHQSDFTSDLQRAYEFLYGK